MPAFRGFTRQVLVLPVFRHYWLWHSLDGAAASAAAAALPKALADWRSGANLEEKFHLMGQHLSRWFQQRLQSEWQKLKVAPDGSLRNWGFKMAQAVLSREDPRETFFKCLPAEQAPVEFTYPDAFQERLVRRRLRHIAADGLRVHRTRLVWWMLAIVPQVPLMVTPLPNITVYYTGYRIYSHYRALQGIKTLEKSLTELDSQQLRALRDALLAYQETSGTRLPPDGWPARLVRQEPQYLDIFDRLKRYQRQAALQRQLEAAGEQPGAAYDASEAACAPEGVPWLTFKPSEQLTELSKVAERERVPMDDATALAVGRAWGTPSLLQNVARARRRSVGSYFPSEVS